MFCYIRVFFDIYLVIKGKLPFGTDKQRKKLLKKIRAGTLDFSGDKFHQTTPELRDLIKMLLILNPARRFNVVQALEHPWIHNEKETLAKLYAKMLI